jgi:glutaredoxin
MASAPDTKLEEKLSLYYRDWCMACYTVKRYLPDLNVEVEMRDILDQPFYYNELINARGRGTVPVLRREFADGTVEWMPESRDIVNYLMQHYSDAA